MPQQWLASGIKSQHGPGHLRGHTLARLHTPSSYTTQPFCVITKSRSNCALEDAAILEAAFRKNEATWSQFRPSTGFRIAIAAWQSASDRGSIGFSKLRPYVMDSFAKARMTELMRPMLDAEVPDIALSAREAERTAGPLRTLGLDGLRCAGAPLRTHPPRFLTFFSHLFASAVTGSRGRDQPQGSGSGLGARRAAPQW